jgi:hypothetical protein
MKKCNWNKLRKDHINKRFWVAECTNELEPMTLKECIEKETDTFNIGGELIANHILHFPSGSKLTFKEAERFLKLSKL